MDDHKIHMQLELVDFDTFRVLNSGFRWIRPGDNENRIYLAEQGVGFQPAASGSFLKSELVK